MWQLEPAPQLQASGGLFFRWYNQKLTQPKPRTLETNTADPKYPAKPKPVRAEPAKSGAISGAQQAKQAAAAAIPSFQYPILLALNVVTGHGMAPQVT